VFTIANNLLTGLEDIYPVSLASISRKICSSPSFGGVTREKAALL
jgi:hypothetical protein